MVGFVYKARAMAFVKKLSPTELVVLIDIAQKDLKERRKKLNEKLKQEKKKRN